MRCQIQQAVLVSKCPCELLFITFASHPVDPNRNQTKIMKILISYGFLTLCSEEPGHYPTLNPWERLLQEFLTFKSLKLRCTKVETMNDDATIMVPAGSFVHNFNKSR
jgi:hypothetical protein